MEQLQSSTDTLQEIHLVPLRRFERRPRNSANFGHRGKPIVQLGKIAVRFPRIAPGPVDGHPTLAGRMFSGDMVLVVRSGILRCGHLVHSSPAMWKCVLSSVASTLAG